MKRLHLFLTEQQLVALRKLAKRTGLPLGDHVRRALDAYLSDAKLTERSRG